MKVHNILLTAVAVASSCMAVSCSSNKTGDSATEVSNFVIDETIKTASQSYRGMIDGDTVYVTVSTSLLWPEKLGDNSLTVLQDSIRSKMFGTLTGKAGRGIDAAIKRYVADLSAFEPDVATDSVASKTFTPVDSVTYGGDSMRSWYTEMTGKFIDLNEQFVTYQVSQSSYAGGAHPYTGTMAFTYDLARGVVLDAQNIFVSGSFKDVLQAVKEQLAAQLETSVDGLEEAGIFVSQLVGLGNVYLVEDAVVFHYNPYEIAPYAMGPIDVTIWGEEIQDYLTPEVKSLLID